MFHIELKARAAPLEMTSFKSEKPPRLSLHFPLIDYYPWYHLPTLWSKWLFHLMLFFSLIMDGDFLPIISMPLATIYFFRLGFNENSSEAESDEFVSRIRLKVTIIWDISSSCASREIRDMKRETDELVWTMWTLIALNGPNILLRLHSSFGYFGWGAVYL